jgi:hypothetical protein
MTWVESEGLPDPGGFLIQDADWSGGLPIVISLPIAHCVVVRCVESVIGRQAGPRTLPPPGFSPVQKPDAPHHSQASLPEPMLFPPQISYLLRLYAVPAKHAVAVLLSMPQEWNLALRVPRRQAGSVFNIEAVESDGSQSLNSLIVVPPNRGRV